jgi:ABC-type Mn2+/Zn2+ transport system permease subunit
VVGAALVVAALGGEARALAPLLLGGRALRHPRPAGVAAADRSGRIRPDAGIASCLSSFYALGAVGLSVAQALPGAAQAGLSHFILGQAATLNEGDAILAGGLALGSVVSWRRCSSRCARSASTKASPRRRACPCAPSTSPARPPAGGDGRGAAGGGD